ncbi:phage tail protein, partial [Streptomyces scabiei]|uniref:phage tail protein n=1 Tax=Streptomyces scabiei TaxID=1930 RepID=UPI0038F61AEE
PESADYKFIIDEGDDANNFKLDAAVELYDGCGNCLEKWFLNNCWPQSCDFQDLDMGSSDVLLAEMTLRYDRAYITRMNCTP